MSGDEPVADVQERQADSFRWMFMSGLGLAGLLSGVVFALLDKVGI